MILQLPFVFLCLLLLLCSCLVVNVHAVQSQLKMDTSQPMITTAQDNQQNHLNGNIYTINNDGKLYSILLDAVSGQATIKELYLDDNITLANEIEGSGSDLSPDNPTNQKLVYGILHHHAYIAFDRTIYIIQLNSSNAFQNYDTIAIDYDPSSIIALSYGQDPYILATYTTPEQRTFIMRYRKYQNLNWGNFGSKVLISSPQWNDLDRVSNVLVYKALDSLNFYDSLFAAIAEGWYIFVTNLIDGTHRTYSTPEPCDNIERMVYSDHKQRMLIQCKEATVYLDAKEKEFSAKWIGVTGNGYIAQSGEYGAVVNDSFVTILELSNGYRQEAVPIEGLVSIATFVDAGSANHYFCYVQQFNQSYRLQCIDIEGLFQNNSSEYLLDIFDSSSAPTDKIFSTCSGIYSRRNVLTVQHVLCSADNCLPLLQIFDMGNVVNSFNVTGLQATFLAYKHTKYELPPTVEPTTTPNTTHNVSGNATTSTTMAPTILTTLDSTSTATILTTLDGTSTATIPTTLDSTSSLVQDLRNCREHLQIQDNYIPVFVVALSTLFILVVIIFILSAMLFSAIRKIKHHGLYDPDHPIKTMLRITNKETDQVKVHS